MAQGLGTGNNQRFLRKPHECPAAAIGQDWQPYIKGSRDKQWFEPMEDVIWWSNNGLSKRLTSEHWGTKGGNGCPSKHLYFTTGVAYKKIGSGFSARIHRYPSIIGNAGSSVFSDDNAAMVCCLNFQVRQLIGDFSPPRLHRDRRRAAADARDAARGEHRPAAADGL